MSAQGNNFFDRKKALRRLRNFFESLFPHSDNKILNDAQEFWKDSAIQKNIQDLSHWKGSKRWGAEEWKKIGETHYELYEKLLLFSGRPINSMVEWGPGGGANAVIFSQKISTIYGVDISMENLNECSRQLKDKNYQGFKKVLIDISNPELCMQFIETKVDFFLCTAVYQHFPGKSYGERVTKIAYSLLQRGGIALIQIRYDDGDPYVATKKRAYKRNVIRFTSYNIPEFWQITESIGFRPLLLTLDPSVKYAYYLLKKE